MFDGSGSQSQDTRGNTLKTNTHHHDVYRHAFRIYSASLLCELHTSAAFHRSCLALCEQSWRIGRPLLQR